VANKLGPGPVRLFVSIDAVIVANTVIRLVGRVAYMKCLELSQTVMSQLQCVLDRIK